MALARSASGPSGLSINTNSANLFGSGANNQPAAPAASGGGGLFGSNTQSSQPATSSAAGGSLFGSNTATASPKPGGLFGSASTTATSQPQQTGSLFGGNTNTAATSQPQQSGGLFGNNAQNQNQQPQQQQSGGGLFGSASNTQQPQQSGGLFGNNATQNQQQPQQQSGGLFGAASSTAQKPAGGLFGGSLNQPSQTAAQPGSLPGLGGSLGIGALGQSTNQQSVPGVRIDLSNLKGTTRFNDLTEQLQKEVEEIDKFIQSQISHHNELESFMPAHGGMLEAVPNDVKFVARKYDGVRNALESDAQAIEAARGLVQQDADHARLSFRAIDNLKLPEQYHTNTFWASRSQSVATANTETDGQDLIGFFSKTADEVDSQLGKFQQNLSEIEMHMHSVHDSMIEQLQNMVSKNGTGNGVRDEIQELGMTLRQFEQGILQVASEVGSAREGMTRLQLGEFAADA